LIKITSSESPRDFTSPQRLNVDRRNYLISFFFFGNCSLYIQITIHDSVYSNPKRRAVFAAVTVTRVCITASWSCARRRAETRRGRGGVKRISSSTSSQKCYHYRRPSPPSWTRPP